MIKTVHFSANEAINLGAAYPAVTYYSHDKHPLVSVVLQQGVFVFTIQPKEGATEIETVRVPMTSVACWRDVSALAEKSAK